MEDVQITLNRKVFERLQLLAEPFVDNPSTVIERLLKHWESAPPSPRSRVINLAKPLTTWRSVRGERFPIGAKLRAKYLSHSFEAVITTRGIEFKDKAFDNPSSAGIAAKESVGTPTKAASTNGWDFWEMLDPTTKQWTSINVLRTAKGD